MEKRGIKQSDRDLLQLGFPPQDIDLLVAITIGQSTLDAFILEQYLAPTGYVADGYSQIKIVVGRPGAGKTHLLRLLTRQAQELGYVAVYLSATDIRLQHVDSLYTTIARQVDMEELAKRLAQRTAEHMGYDLADVPAQSTFLSWLVQQHNHIDTLVKRDVGQVLGGFFKRERVEPNFSLAFTQLASDSLGTHPLSQEDRALLLRWLQGEKLRAEDLHHIHLARQIDRYNARDMVHALADFVRFQGFKGLFVAVDQMEDLPIGRKPDTNRPKYGAAALADAYQSLREMVDGLPSIAGIMVVFAGQREFLELPRGIKSYDALWLRIQHEVVSPLFNRFAQVLDLDRAVQSGLTRADAESLHQHLTAIGIRTRPFRDLPIAEILDMNAGDGVYRRLIQAMVDDTEPRGPHG